MPLKIFQRNGTWYVRGTVWGIHVYETTHTADRAVAEEIRAKKEREIHLDRRVRLAHLPGEEIGHLTSLLIAQLRRISDQPERLRIIDRIVRRIRDET